MEPVIRSLHHVTATVADAQQDLDFYTVLLGLRLVKKTVNFDNPGVYHFYYGDETGTPSTIMTTFPYAGWGVPVGTHGAGQITATSFSVPAGSLAGWSDRLADAAADFDKAPPRFGSPVLAVRDPSGLVLELIESTGDRRRAWTTPGTPEGSALFGVHGVTLSVRSAGPTLAFLTDVLGWRVVREEGARTSLEIGSGGPGATLDVLESPSAPAAVNGLGTVHHVAMAVAGSEEQLAVREDLIARGWAVTEVRDRQYFTSIYFREPGGVLYEVATAGPGFLVDEEAHALGRELKLPPWEEPNRARIEDRLPKVRTS
jgi:glyoxalase family protein